MPADLWWANTVSWYALDMRWLAGVDTAATLHLQMFRWRFPLAAQCVIPLVLIIGSPLLPESPRWLIGRGRHTQARVVLERLHGDPLNLTDNTFAQHEVETISNQLRLDSEMPPLMGNGKFSPGLPTANV
jgi:hypothetical protein